MQPEPTLTAPAMAGLPVLDPLPMLPDIPASSAPPAPVVIFGRDGAGRAHASVFNGSEVDRAETAARLMGMHLTAAASEPLRALASRLPAGRIFADSGRAFVPFCATALYDKLLAATGTPDQARPGPTAAVPVKAAAKAAEGGSTQQGDSGGPNAPGGPGGPSGSAPQRPSDWSAIGRGSHVLACHAPMEGWFEAVVVATKAADSFVLRWRDFPDDPEFTKARKDLGLLPVDSREGMA